MDWSSSPRKRGPSDFALRDEQIERRWVPAFAGTTVELLIHGSNNVLGLHNQSLRTQRARAANPRPPCQGWTITTVRSSVRIRAELPFTEG